MGTCYDFQHKNKLVDDQGQPMTIPQTTYNNICVSPKGELWKIEKEFYKPTCTGFYLVPGNKNNEDCPDDRTFMCGSLEQSGRVAKGWQGQVCSLLTRALSNEKGDYRHPQCGNLHK